MVAPLRRLDECERSDFPVLMVSAARELIFAMYHKQLVFVIAVSMPMIGCHFSEPRLSIPVGVTIKPSEIPQSVMVPDDVLSPPEGIKIERFGDDSNGLWRFVFPDGTVKHKDQSGKDVVVHGGII